jgi:hypothetical protein
VEPNTKRVKLNKKYNQPEKQQKITVKTCSPGSQIKQSNDSNMKTMLVDNPRSSISNI